MRCARCADPTARKDRSPRYRHRLPDGTYRRTPAWSSRVHWATIVLPAAIAAGRDVLARHHIATATFLTVMLTHAAHADDDTGRGVTIDVEHLRLEAGCSERTVQRARAVARELGVAVEVFRGRHLTLDERITAYDAGSRQRGLASVYALGCPRVLARRLPRRLHHLGDDHQARDVAGERGTPPVGIPSGSSSSPRSVVTSAPSADELAALAVLNREGNASQDPAEIGGPAQRHSDGAVSATAGREPRPRGDRTRPGGARSGPRRGEARDPSRPGRRRPRWHPAAVRLAEAVRREVPALHGVPLGRLVPAHTRFALSPAPWTAAQLVATAWHVAAVKGWTTRPGRIRHPAAWWAHLLDGIADTTGHDLPHHSPGTGADGGDGDGAAVIRPDDPWADTLLPTTGTDSSTTTTGRPRTALDAARHPLWSHHQLEVRQAEADAERAELHAQREALRAELRGDGLCEHGAAGADPSGWSPRCALCRVT